MWSCNGPTGNPPDVAFLPKAHLEGLPPNVGTTSFSESSGHFPLLPAHRLGSGAPFALHAGGAPPGVGPEWGRG